jgi:hypothetical protein
MRRDARSGASRLFSTQFKMVVLNYLVGADSHNRAYLCQSGIGGESKAQGEEEPTIFLMQLSEEGDPRLLEEDFVVGFVPSATGSKGRAWKLGQGMKIDVVGCDYNASHNGIHSEANREIA